MGIDIDSFLNKIESKNEKEEVRSSNDDSNTSEKKNYNIEFEKAIIDNFQNISEEIKDKDLQQLKDIYEDLKKFDESMPSKFLSIQSVGSKTLDSLNNQYSSKLLQTLENNATFYANKIKENNKLIEEDLISKEYKVCLKLLKENKEYLQKFPNELANEKHQLFLGIKKYELKLNIEIRNFKLSQSSSIKQTLLSKIKELKNILEHNSTEEIEHKITEIELTMNKIPLLFRSSFVDENILVQKAIVNAEEKIIELKNKKFAQKEKELRIVQEKFQNSIIKKDLNSSLLLYNEILLLFEDLPNTNFKEKNTYLSTLTKLHGQLNNLYVKSNVELLLRSYNNSKIIEEARNYIDHIELTKRISPENVSLIYEKLKKLPKSSHIEQDSMIKKYEILLEKISDKKEHKKEFKEVEDSIELPKTIKKALNNDSEIIDRAIQYLKFVNETHNMSKEMVKKNLNSLNKIKKSSVSEKLIERYTRILKKIDEKEKQTPQKKISVDQNVVHEIQELYNEMKKTTSKKEKSILYKKVLFYLDLVTLPTHKKEAIKQKVKSIYERD
ncbi:MAG: hypothetical protein VXZ40_01410 [Nanoarchaeota archaeon]|nr:hypothetical protein [Nanoarchaeota archaeon]